MPELTVTVRVPLPKQATLAALERAIFKALQAAGRELLLQAFHRLEPQVLTGAKQRRRRRYLLTRFGEIRFFRWQCRTEQGYGYPLDEALRISPGDPCSAWVRQSAAWLAQAHPYRQAARLLSKMIGEPIDHRRLWGWVQNSGKGVRAHFERMRSSLFDDGEVPGFSGPAPKIVSTSADGTFLHLTSGARAAGGVTGWRSSIWPGVPRRACSSSATRSSRRAAARLPQEGLPHCKGQA